MSAGRTFNHPHEDYSNLRPEVTMEAEIDEGEDSAAAVKQLQARAEELVEDHKQNLLQSIEDLRRLSLQQRELVSLQKQIAAAQHRLDEIRKDHPELERLSLGDAGGAEGDTRPW